MFLVLLYRQAAPLAQRYIDLIIFVVKPDAAYISVTMSGIKIDVSWAKLLTFCCQKLLHIFKNMV